MQNQPTITKSGSNSTSSMEEIYLLNIVNFLQQSWKKLVFAAVLGAILGVSNWFFLGNYSAEYVLLNNNINNNYAVNLFTWKVLQKSLPNLAAQIIEEGKVSENEMPIFEAMASEDWWQKHVKPIYAISKADIKDLAPVGKDLDQASSTIINLTIEMTGSSKAAAIDRVKMIANFLRTGSAYLQLRNLINGYQSTLISAQAEIQKQITSTEIEMGFQLQRARNLEELYKRFPHNSNVNQSVVDPKDSGAKYLSISTQIVAVNNDINQSKENLQRYYDRLAQVAVINAFIEKAHPLIDQTFDGLILDQQLLDVEKQVRAELATDDIKKQEALDEIRANLLAVQSRFTRGLEATVAPVSSGKKGIIKSGVGGLVATLLLMLAILLGQQVWKTQKSGSANYDQISDEPSSSGIHGLK